jgi:ribosomal protein S18 acetylase RimI-like enzyme
MPRVGDFVVEPLPNDLVTLVQCMAIDADAFPFDSVRMAFAAKEPSARALFAREYEGGRAVGFIAGYVRPNKPGGVLYVYGIAVDRAMRGRGVGHALLEETIARATSEGLRAITLQVSTANRAAIALYRRCGFVILRRIAGYYAAAHFGDGGDAYEMARAIT